MSLKLTEEEIAENTAKGIAQVKKYQQEHADYLVSVAERITQEFPDPKRAARVALMLSGVVFPEYELDPDVVDDDEIREREYTEERVRDMENARRKVEDYIENFYDRQYGINAAHLGYGILLRFRQIAADAMAEYDKAFMCGANGELPYGMTHEPEWGSYQDWGGSDWNPIMETHPIAVVAHKPGNQWPIRRIQTFASVAECIKEDIACELQIVGGCVKNLQRSIDIGLYSEWPIPYPHTFPLPAGEFVVFAKICQDCWKAFKERYEIGECRIDDPFDGLG